MAVGSSLPVETFRQGVTVYGLGVPRKAPNIDASPMRTGGEMLEKSYGSRMPECVKT